MPEDKNIKVKEYILRNVKLYLFWFIVLLPYTIYIRKYFDEGLLIGFIKIIRGLLLGSTFPASWFLQALIAATLIVFLASKKLGNMPLLYISLVIYLLVVVRSSYWSEAQNNVFIAYLGEKYEMLFSIPMFNAPAACVWVAMGKCFAEESFKIKKSIIALGTVLSFILLFVEWKLVFQLNGTYDNDCYFLLVPSAFFLFLIIKSIHFSSTQVTKFMAQSSIIMYTTHMNLDVLGINGNDTGLEEEVFAHLRKNMMTNDVLSSLFCVSDKSNSEALFERDVQ